jgi:mono/diheme cytochrome c family protein
MKTVLLISFIFMLCACSPAGLQGSEGTTPTAPLSPAADQLIQGETLYQQNCATESCHGVSGEGIRSGDTFKDWPLIGEVYQLRNPNAQVVFDVARSGGEANLRLLSDQQIYDAIAYELSLNGVELDERLTSQNAAQIRSGPASPQADWGEIYPPVGNAKLLPGLLTPEGSLQGDNGLLAIRADQLGLAENIGGKTPQAGGRFAILVIAIQHLGGEALEVDPRFLRLDDTAGNACEPLEIGLAYPMVRFRRQTIEPGHGTAGVVIFGLTGAEMPERLVYNGPDGGPIVVPLR